MRLKLLRWGGWFALVNALFSIAISSRYISTMDWPENPLAWLYFFSMTIGHFSLLSFLPYCLLFIPLIYVARAPFFSIIFLLVFYTLQHSLMLVDTVVFSQYRFHLDLLYIDMLLKAGDQIIGFSEQTWVMAFSGIVILLLMECLFAILIWKKHTIMENKIRYSAVCTTLVMLFAGSHLIHIWADANYEQSITTLTRYYPLLFPATAQKFMMRQGWAASASDRNHQILRTKQVTANGNLNYPLEAMQCSPREEKLNILLIVIDSWRYDAMTPEITPNIFDLSQKALNYTAHFSGGNATRIGIFSLFYGLPGTYWHAFESNQQGPVLLKTLLKNDYKMGIFASAPLSHPEFDRTVFSDLSDFPLKTEGHSTDERDREILRRWQYWLDQHQLKNVVQSEHPKSSFFGFLFFDSLHGYQYPNDYPRHFQPAWDEVNYLLLDNETDPLPFRNFYNNITHFQDSLVGKALDDLKRRELLDKTIIIITGDHGQEFNDTRKNYWGHNGNFTRYQTQVPFIFYWPNRPPATHTEKTSHMDFVPTMLNNLFRCSNPIENYSTGRDLFAAELEPIHSLLMSSYSDYGIFEFETNQITVKNSFGSYDIFDHDYNKLPEAETGTQAALQAMKNMSRFYK